MGNGGGAGIGGAVLGGALGSIVPGIGTAVGAALGGTIGGGMGANSANMAVAQSQEDFQAGMSDTSYQRGVADMEAAGINPILAAGSGGASTPSGAGIPMQNIMQGAVSSATDTARTQQQAAVTNAQVTKTQADTVLSAAQTAQALSSARKAEADIKNTQAGMGENKFLGNLGNAANDLLLKLAPGNSAKAPSNVKLSPSETDQAIQDGLNSGVVHLKSGGY